MPATPPGKRILVTGAAGFIGSHVAEALARRGDRVVGLDNLDPFYDPALKQRTVAQLQGELGDAFSFVEGDIRDAELLARLFAEQKFDAVVHLAALANVRLSIGHAARYFDVNLTGTIGLLDACVAHSTQRFVFASTSSVYGQTDRIPFEESDACARPLAPYPASKRAAELLGFSYHRLHGLNFTALRFFTVYGPRNRPDMMAHLLFDSIVQRKTIELFQGGQLKRDWTYVRDIAQGVVAAVDKPLGYEILNLGRGQPVLLADFVEVAQELAGGSAVLRDAPLPAADVRETYASTDKARELLGYAPTTSVRDGMAELWAWYHQTVKP